MGGAPPPRSVHRIGTWSRALSPEEGRGARIVLTMTLKEDGAMAFGIGSGDQTIPLVPGRYALSDGTLRVTAEKAEFSGVSLSPGERAFAAAVSEDKATLTLTDQATGMVSTWQRGVVKLEGATISGRVNVKGDLGPG